MPLDQNQNRYNTCREICRPQIDNPWGIPGAGKYSLRQIIGSDNKCPR